MLICLIIVTEIPVASALRHSSAIVPPPKNPIRHQLKPQLPPTTAASPLHLPLSLSQVSGNQTTARASPFSPSPVLISQQPKFLHFSRKPIGPEFHRQSKRQPFLFICSFLKDMMGPRWKGKGAETEAVSDPMSKIVSQLQSSLTLSNSQGLLMSSCVLLQADTTQTDLLLRSCFGDPVITAEKDKQWFQLSMEEAFYLSYVLKCIKIVAENNTEKNGEQLWKYMSSRRQNFPYLFKAYSHLRMKNWVVKSGSRYGVDFVAYRHHPRLVHSEYAVLVLSDDDSQGSTRLRVWSDYECTLRLCGSVAKTLLVLHIQKQGKSTESPSNLESFFLEEQTVTRWIPQQSREDQTVDKDILHCVNLG